MAAELERTLFLIQSGEIRRIAEFRRWSLDAALLRLRHVAFSGDGEPTLRKNFAEIVQEVVHVRSTGELILASNLFSSPMELGWTPGLSSRGLRYFTRDDEILDQSFDAGTRRRICARSTGPNSRWRKSWTTSG